MNRWSLLIGIASHLCGGAVLIAGHPASAGACGSGGCGGSAHALPFGWSGCGPHFAGPLGPAPEVCAYCPRQPRYCAPPPVPVYGGTYRGTFAHDPIPFLWDFSYHAYYPAYYPPRSDYAMAHLAHHGAVAVPVKSVSPGGAAERLPAPGDGDKPPVKPVGPDGGL